MHVNICIRFSDTPLFLDLHHMSLHRRQQQQLQQQHHYCVPPLPDTIVRLVCAVRVTPEAFPCQPPHWRGQRQAVV